jgi:hypothetical protein
MTANWRPKINYDHLLQAVCNPLQAVYVSVALFGCLCTGRCAIYFGHTISAVCIDSLLVLCVQE